MATFQRFEVTITRVEFRVPATGPLGAPWVAVSAAIGAAHQELISLGLLNPDADAADDAIRVQPTDDAVIVSIETRTEAAAGDWASASTPAVPA